MAKILQKPKGTLDVVPSEVYKWHTVEKLAKETAEQYGFKEIRVPTFEEVGLFVRSVGEATDVVQKEMYKVTASGDSEFALRPEGTAGTMRAIIENGILNEGFPQKVFYMLSCFRHENNQKDRYREFHQFGCEMVGTANPKADAEVISLAQAMLDRVGLDGVELNINSIGCPECRAEYRKALVEYFEDKKDELCETCRDRLVKNPMRILDCKSPVCSKIAENAPVVLDYLCDECKEHFEELKKYLDIMGIEYKINPKIVRGLDYYTKTVFEFVLNGLTVCGGGRYDGLLEELGANKTPALGFGMGLERLITAMTDNGCEFIEPETCDLYIASIGKTAEIKAMEYAIRLRDEGYFVEYDLVGRGIKPQMKYANKIGAKFVMVLGDGELESGKVKLKDMATGEETEIPLDDNFTEIFSDAVMNKMFDGIDDDSLGELGEYISRFGESLK